MQECINSSKILGRRKQQRKIVEDKVLGINPTIFLITSNESGLSNPINIINLNNN